MWYTYYQVYDENTVNSVERDLNLQGTACWLLSIGKFSGAISKMITLGIDIGSTTAKLILAENKKVIYRCYERHFSQVRQKTLELMLRAKEFLNGKEVHAAISGSAGLGIAKSTGVDFIQEVFATGEAIEQVAPDTDVVIELGGEDAKIIFFSNGLDERMNGSCAGGTGAFIDQMATLLNVSMNELDDLSLKAERIYPIASRCGVFAKTDIQPLLNQGARKEDVAASIYHAVVNQTIAGLAQGRKIDGKVMFLGGPLYFCKGLQNAFVEVLKLSQENAVFPDFGQYAVAIGAAMFAARQGTPIKYEDLIKKLENATEDTGAAQFLPPLFESESDYQEFTQRHAEAYVERVDSDSFSGEVYLGIDCGSTTTKLILMTEDSRLLYTYYNSNKGNPVEVIRSQLEYIYSTFGNRITIKGSAVTGYGEDLIKNAFSIDYGIVETMAHFRAARHFNRDVDFILDIGGQDMKCFKVHNNSIDSIMLNEACSSGCGSFIETFASSMGYSVADFARLGLYAKHPVDLGSRCTVFMNSSVKQAQKDGAGVDDISAGISMSVVRNAIYKVIRAHSADELGQNIVVQGGTFLNDAVLRSFEAEMGRNVIRPDISGLMGAYGAALYAKKKMSRSNTPSETVSSEQLRLFKHESKSATCKGCANNCSLTINTFGGVDRGSSKKFVSGNRCERGIGKEPDSSLPNIYSYKMDKIKQLIEGQSTDTQKRARIGFPFALGMFETLPFWFEIFTRLGFEVVLSSVSSRKLYIKGQHTIPSDTVCYPAKLMHGHIEDLLEQGVDVIFYPCITYNFNEAKGDNCYNCPVVAYYSELLDSNVESLAQVKFLFPHLGLRTPKELEKALLNSLNDVWSDITRKDIRSAISAGYKAYESYMNDIRLEGKRAMDYARKNGRRIAILAGRPYHIDPEINHGIDKLIASFGLVVVSEDCVSDSVIPVSVNVLNQWTYHARMYNAARYAVENDDCELIQLVSFGCGIDAITTDEIRDMLEDNGKLYTQLKIDEITNLGAVKIRIRSLIESISERNK